VTRHCGNRTWLAGAGLLIATGKPTENVTDKHLAKHVAYVLYKFHICFFVSVLKKQTRCTYVWRHKDVKAQREAGPAFSRLDRLLPIGPRAEEGPALRLLTYANLHFLRLLTYANLHFLY